MHLSYSGGPNYSCGPDRPSQYNFLAMARWISLKEKMGLMSVLTRGHILHSPILSALPFILFIYEMGKWRHARATRRGREGFLHPKKTAGMHKGRFLGGVCEVENRTRFNAQTRPTLNYDPELQMKGGKIYQGCPVFHLVLS